MKKLFSLFFFIFMSAVIIQSSPALAETRVVIASTTSAQATGMYDVILPAYYKWTSIKGIRLDVVAVGTGQAIKIAKRGDADILFVHDKDKEMEFIKEGYGVGRHDVMYNDFVVVGPPADPAKIKGAKTAPEAFRRILESGALFISRGDESGTNSRELKIWKAAGLSPAGKSNYLSIGQGMGPALRMADEKAAYTLSDRGTYRKLKPELKGTEVLFQGDASLRNQYGVMAVNPRKYPKVRYNVALDFIRFVTSPEGQKIIGGMKDKAGNPLFVPDAK